MPLQDVTPLMDGYRECARHLWNIHFSGDAEREQDWDLHSDFSEIAAGLFRILVLRKLGRAETQVVPDDVEPRQPFLFLRLDAPVGSWIHVNRSTEVTSGLERPESRNVYWDDPVSRVEADALDLRFLRFFDWDDLGFRDFAYYRVRIVASRPHPQLIGRDALLPVRSGVKVLHDPDV